MTQRSKTFAFAFLAAVFVAGGAAGWVVHDLVADARPRRGRHDVDALLHDLNRDLRLTPAQRDSVRAVLVRRRTEIRGLWETMHPQVDGIRAATQIDIDSFLTPEQVKRHRQLIADEERRRAQERRPGGSR